MTSLETIQAYLEEQRARVEEELERLLPPAGEYPPSVHRAMRYSIFAGGKRLRPALCLESGELFGGDEKNLRRLGCALEMIHTYALIAAAVRSGAIAAHAPEADVERMTVYGEKIGLAFQIADDLLDVLGSRQALGKAVGKDGSQQKATYPALHGVEESQRIAAGLVGEACHILDP